MILSIDASDPLKVKLSLGGKDHIFETSRVSEQLLPEIKKFLQKNELKLQQLSEIKVHAGPGHFSRIRTAVAVVNALAFALNLPQKIVQPIYDKEPNITFPK